MENYKFILPTTLFVGEGVLQKKAEVMLNLGKKAFIITGPVLSGRISGEKHQSVKDVEAALSKVGIEYRICDKVVCNPPVDNVAEVAQEARAFGPDFLIACGGGSSIDVTKGVSILINYPDEDPYYVLYKMINTGGASSSSPRTANMVGLGDGTLPVVAVPTTAGTGSEMTSSAVLTNEQLHTKMVPSQRVFCTAAFIDYRYIKTCPKELLDSAAMDALTHGVEGYLNNTSNFLVRSFAMTGFKLFAKFKDHLMTGELTDEDYENMALASNIFGTSEMCGTTITHGMGYPLTEDKGLSHGLSCAVFLGEFLRGFKDKSLVQPVVDACGFDDVNAFADYVNDVLQPHVKFTCTNKEIDEWTETMITGTQKWRLPKNPEPLTREDIRSIYVKSLSRAIVD